MSEFIDNFWNYPADRQTHKHSIYGKRNNTSEHAISTYVVWCLASFTSDLPSLL